MQKHAYDNQNIKQTAQTVVVVVVVAVVAVVVVVVVAVVAVVVVVVVVVVLLLPSSLLLAVSNEHKKEVDNTKRPLLKKIKGKVFNEDDCF